MNVKSLALVVALAAALGACGDRSDEAGAPVNEPTAPRVDSGASPDVAEAPVAPAAPASEPDADAAQTTGTPPAVAEAQPRATPGPPEPTAAAQSPAAESPAPSATPAPAAASPAPGTVLRAEKLYSEPAATSKVTASVAKGASVEILGKQAGWLRVKAGSQSGWIRLLSVRAGVGGLGGVGVGDVVGAATTRSDPTRVVAVAGLRGLSDEDLEQAEFNAEELARMEARNVSATQTRSFASQVGLAAVSVPDLPKPQAQ